jgi:hypothetical protein
MSLEDARAFELGDPRFVIALATAFVDTLERVVGRLDELGDRFEHLERERFMLERAQLDELARIARKLEIGG